MQTPTGDETVDGVRVTELSVQPTAAVPGEPVTVVAAVENDAPSRVSEPLRLRLYGEVVAFRNVSLSGGEIRDVEFVRSFESAGSYEAQVGNAAVTISVEDDSDGTATAVEATGPGFSILATVLALAAAVLSTVRRRRD